MVEHLHMVRCVVGSIPHGEPIELFLVPKLCNWCGICVSALLNENVRLFLGFFVVVFSFDWLCQILCPVRVAKWVVRCRSFASIVVLTGLSLLFSLVNHQCFMLAKKN